jgi:acetyl esterase/lipase
MKQLLAPLGIAALLLMQQAAVAGPLRDRLADTIANFRQGGEHLDVEDRSPTSDEAFLQSGVSILRDIAYGPDPLQHMDVYIPRKAHGAAVVFIVHGGAWLFDDKAAGGVVDNKAVRWLARGMIFVSVNYRMMPNADPLTQTNDVATALSKAQKLAAS